MSEAKQRCQMDACNRAASTHCFCCNKNVCTRHFTEHIDTIKAQIDPLANDINTMVEKIQGLTIEQITEGCFAELQQWRVDMHQLIDEIFLIKTKEIEDLIEKNKNQFVEHKKQQFEMIVKIQDDVKQLVEDGDATFEQIQLLKNQLAIVETNLTSFQKDFLSINAKVFAQGLVTVSSNLTKPPVIQNRLINQLWPQNFISDSTTVSTNSAVETSTTACASGPLIPAWQQQARIGVFSNVFRSVQPQHPSNATSFSGFGSNSTLAPSLFGAQPARFGNNQSSSAIPSSFDVFQFSNNEQK